MARIPYRNRAPRTQGPRGESVPVDREGLPESERPYGLCPRCGKQSSFDELGKLAATYGEPWGQGRVELDQVASLVCRNCSQPVIVFEEKWINEEPFREWWKHRGPAMGDVEYSYRGFFWWPIPEASDLTEDIPSDIRRVFSEAARCFYANAFSASVVMARRSLEALAVDKGQTKGRLFDRLKALAQSGDLHPSIVDWADEIRLLGNTGAHFDPINEAAEEDAGQLMRFLRELLKLVYEMPAEIARKRSTSP